jgi:hypothetical protein
MTTSEARRPADVIETAGDPPPGAIDSGIQSSDGFDCGNESRRDSTPAATSNDGRAPRARLSLHRPAPGRPPSSNPLQVPIPSRLDHAGRVMKGRMTSVSRCMPPRRVNTGGSRQHMHLRRACRERPAGCRPARVLHARRSHSRYGLRPEEPRCGSDWSAGRRGVMLVSARRGASLLSSRYAQAVHVETIADDLAPETQTDERK